VTDIQDGEVSLQWNVPEYDGGCAIKQYIIEKCDAHKNNWSAAITSPSTYCTVAKLKVDGKYQFRVCAENEAGTGPWLTMPNSVTASKPTNPPGPPNDLEITNIVATGCQINWRKPTNNGGSEITGYIVEARKEGTSTWKVITQTSAFTMNFRAVGLDANGDYWFKVSALNKAGQGKCVETTEAVHLREPPKEPGAPQPLLQIEPATSTSLNVSWSPCLTDGGSPLTGYTILIRDVTRTAWLQAATVGPHETTCEIKDLITGSEYHVRILAVNAVGQSEPLQSKEPVKVDRPKGSVHPPGPCTPPLAAKKVTGNTVTLTWLPPTDTGNRSYITYLIARPILRVNYDNCAGGSAITDYIISKREMSGKSWEELSPVAEFLNEFTVTGLKEGGRYMFKIAAKNIAGVGETIQTKDAIHCKKTAGLCEFHLKMFANKSKNIFRKTGSSQ
jgi:hypothetical protein